MAGKKRKAMEMELPTREQLLHTIKTIDTANPLRDKALICMEYLTGARVSELLGDNVKRYQVEVIDRFGIKFLQVSNVKVLKRKQGIKRNIIIPVEKERPFIAIMIEYINLLAGDEPIFDITRQRAWQIVKKNTGYFNHFFRHMRTTHLTTDYGFSAQELKTFFGWATTSMADFYSHLSIDDIARKMASASVGVTTPPKHLPQ